MGEGVKNWLRTHRWPRQQAARPCDARSAGKVSAGSQWMVCAPPRLDASSGLFL